MTLFTPDLFGKAERLTEQVQAKVTPSEYRRLVEIRDELHSLGLTDVTISSLLRTFLITGIRAYTAEQSRE
jgi:hypothetical protein